MSATGMKQRCWEHDYCAPSFYMLTIVTAPRRECLSEVLWEGRDVAAGAAAGSVVGAAPAPTLWEEGYQDSILLHRGQLKAMANYIADNPRRHALKCANPELFTVGHSLTVAPSRTCPAIGNRFLLDRPVKRQIQISRRISSEALADKKEKLLYAAKHGAVLVSPCISPGEKEIARAALEADLPLIVILANGLPPHYKPPGRYFDACANGNLLMLAPLPYTPKEATITREQCLTLNEWTAAITAESDDVQTARGRTGPYRTAAPPRDVKEERHERMPRQR